MAVSTVDGQNVLMRVIQANVADCNTAILALILHFTM